MKRNTIVVLFLILNSMFAQELKISYEELIKLTSENNLTIKIYEEKINQNKLKEKEIFLGTLPQIKMTGRYSRLSEIEPFIIELPLFSGLTQLKVYEPVEEQFYSRLSLDFPLFTGFRQINSIKAQNKLIDVSKEEIRQIKSEIIFKAKELYLSLYLARQLLKVIEANIEFLEKQKKIAEDFYNNGIIQKNELLKVDISLTQAKIKFLEHQSLIKTLNSSLCQVLNIDLDTKIIPVVDIDEIIKTNNEEDYQLYEKPELVGLKYFIQANEYLKKVAYASLLPNLFFNAGYDYAKPNPKYFPVKNEWKYSWDVNLVLQFTLWDWMLPLNKVKQIEAQIKQVEYQLSHLVKKSEIEKSDLLSKIETERKKFELMEKELEYAEEKLRILENKTKEGLLVITDLLDANRQKIEAETRLIESKIKYQLLTEELKKIHGLY